MNDRTDPAVDAVLGLSDAQFEHESFWRGEPSLIFPDSDVTSVAHNAVVWGYLRGLYGTGAESAFALATAERVAWRGIVPEGATPHLHRILAGLLSFLWGQQYVKHLQGWMLRAHTRVLEIAVARVAEKWSPPETSPAAAFVRELTASLDALDTPVQSGSRFARARAALRDDDAGALNVDVVAASVEGTIAQCSAVDPYAAADLAAWVIGDVLERERQGTNGPEPRQSTLLAFRTLHDRLARREEGWILPYLSDGFAQERETGGMDLLGRWSAQVL